MAVRPPIASLTVRPPRGCDIHYSLSKLLTHDNVLQGHWGEILRIALLWRLILLYATRRLSVGIMGNQIDLPNLSLS